MKLRRESSAENRKGCGPAHNREGMNLRRAWCGGRRTGKHGPRSRCI